jgi:hypothetical protein
MNRLSDELLNKYIDGDLDAESLKEVKTILKESEVDRERLKILSRVDEELKNIKELEVRSDFTSRIMSKISVRFKPKRSDKYFIISVSSFFVLLSLAILGTVIALMIQSPGETSSSEQVINFLVSSLDNFGSFLGKIFSGSGISIFGSIISFGILITAYFFFEGHKRIKEIQDKL